MPLKSESRNGLCPEPFSPPPFTPPELDTEAGSCRPRLEFAHQVVERCLVAESVTVTAVAPSITCVGWPRDVTSSGRDQLQVFGGAAGVATSGPLMCPLLGVVLQPQAVCRVVDPGPHRCGSALIASIRGGGASPSAFRLTLAELIAPLWPSSR